MTAEFGRLEDVILDELFPEVDLALRRGRHIDRDDAALYAFLSAGAPFLDVFYARFGAELVHKEDGYFYLLPTGDRLGKRLLSPGEMLVGQALTLLYLDPSTVQEGGIVSRDHLLSFLAGLLGSESLLRMFNPKRRRIDERVAEETVRSRVGEALRRLANLGFLEALPEHHYRLRPALLRFAEPVRGTASPEAALERLVAKGELSYIEAATEEEALPEHEGDEGEADEGTDSGDAEEPGEDT